MAHFVCILREDLQGGSKQTWPSLPPPQLYRENGWLIMEGNFSHNKTSLGLHTYLKWMSLQAEDRVLSHTSHLLRHLLALPKGKKCLSELKMFMQGALDSQVSHSYEYEWVKTRKCLQTYESCILFLTVCFIMASSSCQAPFVAVFCVKGNSQVKVAVIVKQKEKGFVFQSFCQFSVQLPTLLCVFTVRPSTAARAQRTKWWPFMANVVFLWQQLQLTEDISLCCDTYHNSRYFCLLLKGTAIDGCENGFLLLPVGIFESCSGPSFRFWVFFFFFFSFFFFCFIRRCWQVAGKTKQGIFHHFCWTS